MIETVKILVVDDLPERLLVYRAILEQPGLEIVGANSGADALRKLLEEEYAVIVLDVNMPGMDGFEAASLIRARKRCAHTPIIFATAHVDEVHALRGYAHGAVDYILTPVAPEILRTKIGVFVDLHRLNRAALRRAAADVAQARGEQARLSAALEHATDFVAHASADGSLLHVNAAGRRMLALAPGDEAPATVAALHPGWAARLVVDQGLPTARGAGIWIGESALLDARGREVPVSQIILAHRGQSGEVESISVVARDITERQRAERALRESESRLRAMVGQAAVGIVLVDPSGRMLEANERMCQILGRDAGEICALACADLIHPDEREANGALIRKLVEGERLEFSMEQRHRHGDGSWVWVNATVSPMLDERGRVHRLIAVIEDIRARKAAEDEVRRHRDRLEELVRERTAALEASHERLRLADRLASIGTLAAGLGHDMGNLLFPVEMRLASMARAPLPDAVVEDVRAIADACKYLKQLSRGLRLLAIGPEGAEGSEERTELAPWLADLTPFLRHALRRGIELRIEAVQDLPALAIGPGALTQAVFNIVQNAGDAMKARAEGTVRVRASLDADGRRVALEVADDGPGMSDETLRRCMEPFFTTKSRGISTGLGLALVRGAVHKAGGEIDIRSRPGEGTAVRLLIPVAAGGAGQAESSRRRTPALACVNVADARMGAYVCTALRSLDVDVVNAAWTADPAIPLLVIDDPGGRWDELEAFLSEEPTRRAIVFGATNGSSLPDQIICLESRPAAERVRVALQEVVRARRVPVGSAPR